VKKCLRTIKEEDDCENEPDHQQKAIPLIEEEKKIKSKPKLIVIEQVPVKL